MRRDQTLHERLIPLLVEGIGARSYLEFGTHKNETISKVNCPLRYGVDISPYRNLGDVFFFQMTTQEFIRDHAAKYAPFDFVFIDADHNHDAVRDDFWGIWSHLAVEGLIAFHDSNPATLVDTVPGLCGDSWRFAQELCGHEAITLPYHPGLTIVRNRLQWGPDV